MTDSLSFKAYLKRDGQEVEVRRFGIDSRASISYMNLRSKIQTVFPSIQNDQFQLFWQDSDKDYIRVDSDEELLEALNSSNQQPLKLYIHVQTNNSQGSTTGRQTHPGVVCDGCEGGVTGYRYKCVTCPDYDLCSTCEGNGLHSEHFMLRMPTPLDAFGHQPKFVRKLFLNPHKFHKRHGWTRMPPPPRGCGDSYTGAGRCPYSRRGEGQNPTAGLSGITDMFDFSALMDFIESLGVATGEQREASGNVGASASTNNTSSSSNEASDNSQSQGNQSQELPRQMNGGQRENSPTAEYLTNIGKMVANVLNPLGVDVTFDVRTRPSQSKASNNPSPTTSTNSQAPPTTPQDPSTSQTPTIPSQSVVTNLSQEVLAAPTTTSQTVTPPLTTNENAKLLELTRERRNSDDWTLLNRESPTRSETVAMDVDESRGPKPKTPPPSVAQDTASPSAPPHFDNVQDSQGKQIQEAIEILNAMGFNFEPTLLRDVLQRQNCDIPSVLDTILNITGKK